MSFLIAFEIVKYMSQLYSVDQTPQAFLRKKVLDTFLNKLQHLDFETVNEKFFNAFLDCLVVSIENLFLSTPQELEVFDKIVHIMLDIASNGLLLSSTALSSQFKYEIISKISFVLRIYATKYLSSRLFSIKLNLT